MKANNSFKKLCFAASSGGHLEQILMLRPLMKKYDSFLVTEKTSYQKNNPEIRTLYLKQVNRREKKFPVLLLQNTISAVKILHREKPDIIISTGVLAVVPLCILGKLTGRKLIYIESFAKVTSPTLTGRILYRFADQFYVQWEPMLKVYPKAIYLGGIY
ncbi:MAG: polysaccharide biosynthesis protein [Blautia sp.]|nr:polysaccharide biosynthesis protein [Blautia sp.]